MRARENQPAPPHANQPQRLLGIIGCHRFVSHVSNQMGERFPLVWVVVEDAWGE
jgi:hypothetical protein